MQPLNCTVLADTFSLPTLHGPHSTEVQIDKDDAEEAENMKDVTTEGDWVIEPDDDCYETEPDM